MLSRLEQSSATGGDDVIAGHFGLDVRGIMRLFGALQSNGFASGIYLHPAMTNHSCRCGTAPVKSLRFCRFQNESHLISVRTGVCELKELWRPSADG